MFSTIKVLLLSKYTFNLRRSKEHLIACYEHNQILKLNQNSNFEEMNQGVNSAILNEDNYHWFTMLTCFPQLIQLLAQRSRKSWCVSVNN